MEEVPEALQRLVRALERANVKYVVVDAEGVNSLAAGLEREGVRVLP